MENQIFDEVTEMLLDLTVAKAEVARIKAEIESLLNIN